MLQDVRTSTELLTKLERKKETKKESEEALCVLFLCLLSNASLLILRNESLGKLAH